MARVRTFAIQNIIAANMRAARLRAGLSQAQLAASLYITTQQLSKYENADNRISACRLWQMAELTGSSVEQFYSLCKERQATHHALATPIALLNAFEQLSPEQKQALTTLALDMARGATIASDI